MVENPSAEMDFGAIFQKSPNFPCNLKLSKSEPKEPFLTKGSCFLSIIWTKSPLKMSESFVAKVINRTHEITGGYALCNWDWRFCYTVYWRDTHTAGAPIVKNQGDTNFRFWQIWALKSRVRVLSNGVRQAYVDQYMSVIYCWKALVLFFSMNVYTLRNQGDTNMYSTIRVHVMGAIVEILLL